MLYMIKRICKSTGKVDFRKAGVYEHSNNWGKNGKAWTSVGAFKSMLQRNYKTPANPYRNHQGILDNNLEGYDLSVLCVDLVGESVVTTEFEKWCEENLNG